MQEPFAVTPWELEAERRREVVKADFRAARPRLPRDPENPVVSPSRFAFRAADPADRAADTARGTHPAGALVPGK